MIKLSKLTDYAVVILVDLARQSQISSDELQSAAKIAKRTALPEPTVSKILKILSRADIVNSIRGAYGGYSLPVAPQDLSVRRIIEAIDGPIALTSCVDQAETCCSAMETCNVSGKWDKVNEAIVTSLDTITLIDMMPRENANYITMTTDQLLSDENKARA